MNLLFIVLPIPHGKHDWFDAEGLDRLMFEKNESLDADHFSINGEGKVLEALFIINEKFLSIDELIVF